jgi:basic amino acid/polyamine antiporter, APA family
MNFNQLFRKKSAGKITGQGDEDDIHGSLNKVLRVKDLTFFGIAAIIGAGSFSSIGSACFTGGPGVIFLFLICAVACGFTALCYAEFASRVPVSGSAYTYAYVSFGELFAWIIGWALIMEYSIGNIYVAFSWSGYFSNLIEGFGMHLPDWLSINYMESHQAFMDAAAGKSLNAWNSAPQIAGLRIIFDLPAVFINVLITWLVYKGVKESRNASNAMVILKLVIIALVIAVGIFYVDINNWTPFIPNGFKGVMAGVSGVFFAYIGFDAVSTLAEESENPQRDLPRGMMYSLVICTVIFVVLALVLTGMVSYTQLNVPDPLAAIFAMKGVKWMLFIVSIAAVVAMTSVILVFQMGQPRIWMSMSRDGLLPKKFASIHPKYKTPGFSTIVTGLVVGIPIFFTDRQFVLDFTSIGTLFAFVLVCGGVLMLPKNDGAKQKGKFQLPYINGQWIVPGIILLSFSLLFLLNKEFLTSTFTINSQSAAVNIPMIVFFFICFLMAALSYLKKFSLIPVLGLLSCCYLLTGMAAVNWKWFFIWFLIGLVIYFSYSFRKSNLNISNT